MPISKVVVSAAGQGTRMLSLSEHKSKHLIAVENRPFLAYLLDNILQAGYREIIIVTGFRDDMIRAFLKAYKPSSNSMELLDGRDYTISLVNQFDSLGPKQKIYGTACPLMCVKDMIGNENFISLVGDNFYTVEDLKEMNVDDDFNYVAGRESKNPEKYGVLISDNGFLKQIVEKPKEFMGNLINTSLYKFTPEIFEKVFEIEKSSRGEYEITDAISLLAKKEKVKIKRIKGFWMDFGRPEDIKKFAEFLQHEGK